MPIITCPSGLVFEVRRWKLKDMEAMARDAQSGTLDEEAIANIVKAAWKRTIDRGPYRFIEPGEVGFDWKRLFKADIMWALYRLRAESFPANPERGWTGEHYTFDSECGAHPVPVKSPQVIRLCDLRMRPLPDSSRVLMLEGQPFKTKTPDGREISFRAPTLEVDAELRTHLKRMKRKADPSDFFGAQTTRIEGEGTDIASRIRFFAEMDLVDFIPVRDAMSRAACHVISVVNAVCTECGRNREVSLPLAPGFFMPPDPMRESPEEEPSEEPQDSEHGSDGSS